MWVTAEEGFKTKHSINPPVWTDCQWKGFFFYYLLYKIFSHTVFGFNTRPLCHTLRYTDLHSFHPFVVHGSRWLEMRQRLKRQAHRWIPISCIFCMWKIICCCVQFQFQVCVPWPCVNRGFTVHNYQVGILAPTAKCCLVQTIISSCKCYMWCMHLFICNFLSLLLRLLHKHS